MARSALAQVSSLGSLRSAWRYIDKRTRGGSRLNAGVDGESVAAFSKDARSNLREIRTRLLSDYTYSSLKAHLAPKPNGGSRVICVPTLRDRIVQRAVLDYLSAGDKCDLANSVSYGFVRSRTVKGAVNRAKNLRRRYRWAYKTDISAFFDSMERGVLKELIERDVPYPSIRTLLWRAANCEIREMRRARQRKLRSLGIREGRGVRQGMPLAPLFANLMLRKFDKAIEAAGIRMVRYADDFIIFCEDERSCRIAEKLCERELVFLNLEATASKTFIYKPKQTAEFLGVGLAQQRHGYAVRLLDRQLDEIRNRVLQMADFDRLGEEGVTLSMLSARLDGLSAGYLGAYDFCDNLAKLDAVLEASKQEVLRRIYSSVGIDVSSLSAQQRRFLELCA